MCAMHSTSNKIKFTPYSDVNEVIDELYESPHSIYQGYLETSREEVISFLIQFNSCTANIMK